MLKPFVAACFTVFFYLSLQAQFSVKTMADSIKNNADVVKRLEETTIEIKSPSKAIVHRKWAYTILNEHGAKHANYIGYYDKFNDLQSISGTLFDEAGNKVKQVKKKDIADISGNANASTTTMATDDRYKTHNFYCQTYPYTILYEDESVKNGILSLETFSPVDDENIGVEQSKLTIIAPKDYVLRYKTYNYPNNPTITEIKDQKQYVWEVKNYAPILDEPFSPRWFEITPTVITAPSLFEIDEYAGDMSTWQGFGKFIATLNAGRDVLPDDIKAKVTQIISPLKNDKEKAIALYKFMQQNTRYISIQLGIGGWRPFDAKYVASKKYGDCKALSNYMVALLKQANIKAHYVLVRAGENARDMFTNFSSNQFNHAIACVPLNTNDTMWLECTSQVEHAGYMGEFTGNRYALAITDSGGVVVRTPQYNKQQNTVSRKTLATIDPEGNATVKVETIFTGLEQDDYHGRINYLNKEEMLKFLRSNIKLSTYDINNFNYEVFDINGLPAVKETIDLKVYNYASITGKRLFINPNFFSQTNLQLSEEKRLYDIVYPYSFTNNDSTTIQMPQGYTLEGQLKTKEINNIFGLYRTTCTIQNNIISYNRYTEHNKGNFSKDLYDNFVNFYKEKYKADKGTISFVKQ